MIWIIRYPSHQLFIIYLNNMINDLGWQKVTKNNGANDIFSHY